MRLFLQETHDEDNKSREKNNCDGTANENAYSSHIALMVFAANASKSTVGIIIACAFNCVAVVERTVLS